MKKNLVFAIALMLFSVQVFAQQKTEDKSKRPSPPATVSQKLKSGVTVTIDYSRPALKGRTIGKDVEPMDSKVWRTGANEATVFQVDRAVSIDGVNLPEGKYGLFTIFNGQEVTFIFNKTWNQWGAFQYKEEDDQLRVKSTWHKSNKPAERLTFEISPNGKVSVLWGDREASFVVK